ncbi:MAG: DUF305 domain-containing protein [Propionibacteriales bacterium]|nr:DUF305 domain-containing protein [Propionibacteriales bacterium]
MKRLPILVVTLIVVITATIVGVALLSLDDDRRTGPGPMMMGGNASADEPDYLVEMVAHHEEAVAAARQLARSERPEMRAFGDAIVKSQSAQIEQMSAWLADWYPEQNPDAGYQPMMRDLTELSGDRLDLVFLEDMVGHHMMAVMMSQRLLSQGSGHREVADLARSIRDDQHAEIIRMQRWLSEWFDIDWFDMRHGPGMMGRRD